MDRQEKPKGPAEQGRNRWGSRESHHEIYAQSAWDLLWRRARLVSRLSGCEWLCYTRDCVDGASVLREFSNPPWSH
ncbi:hypothetical protein NITMOv2_0965 [Nitrospira moscoviensis]|uniref:Uncharacterized protein n=1 Tax=Nitrospira moscoviensis TaxID=42253 RepID=A0A0K2G9Y0_NITMO|nr:hypothetical protein NITMOv2_0965 [Nitrospira moscoviensis]